QSASDRAPPVEFVLDDLPAQGVAVNPQDVRRPRLISVDAVQYAFDKTLLEFANGLIEENSAIHHLPYEAFQLVLHVCTLQRMRESVPGAVVPVNAFSASPTHYQSKFETLRDISRASPRRHRPGARVPAASFSIGCARGSL